MRYPNPKPVTLPNGTDYMPDAFLRELVWSSPMWMDNVETFDRVTAAFASGAGISDEDYTVFLNVLRNLKLEQYPHITLELAHMRNQFVLAPKEAPVKVPVKVAPDETSTESSSPEPWPPQS
jgi:hypothetical protein